jgi:hypothetical protein
MTAPKCEDCRRHVQSGELRGFCGLRAAKYWHASSERRDGHCGPEGRLFQPKEGKRDE